MVSKIWRRDHLNREEKKRNREEWERRIAEWNGSGLTHAEYCRRNDLKTSKMLYWHKKLSGKGPENSTFVQMPISVRTGFAPIRDRKLLSGLSRCAWESLKMVIRRSVRQNDAVPRAAIAIQTFGDFLGFNPHCHILCTDGCFYGNGMFRVTPNFKLKDLEVIFRHKVLEMLLSNGKITHELIDMLIKWRHSGFSVFCGPRIYPRQEEAMENLARYIIRACFSQERMTYLPEQAKVIYESKDGKKEKAFDALEWLAAMCSHVPNKGEQMVRYYGYYSNVCRGKCHKAGCDALIPCILEPEENLKAYRKNWARLIRKIYEVDPLTCPKCHGSMRIISFIQDQEVVEKILKHLGLWLVKPSVHPKANAPPRQLEIDYWDSQVPPPEEPSYTDPDYSIDAYVS